MVGDHFDFFVSHAGADRAWAEWVAWQLMDAGYTVELDVWDWAAGQDTLNRRRRILGDDHLDTLRSASNLAYYTSQLENAGA